MLRSRSVDIPVRSFAPRGVKIGRKLPPTFCGNGGFPSALLPPLKPLKDIRPL